jgi:hypothetical protein
MNIPCLLDLYQSGRPTTMIRNNPFGQGGWSHSDSNSTSSSTPVYGALPTSMHQNSNPIFVAFTFVFTPSRTEPPSILNSTVYAPHSRPYLQVITDSLLPDYTIVKDANNATVAVIGWAEHPFVELNGAPSRRRVRDWLPLSEERK